MRRVSRMVLTNVSLALSNIRVTLDAVREQVEIGCRLRFSVLKRVKLIRHAANDGTAQPSCWHGRRKCSHSCVCTEKPVEPPSAAVLERARCSLIPRHQTSVLSCILLWQGMEERTGTAPPRMDSVVQNWSIRVSLASYGLNRVAATPRLLGAPTTQGCMKKLRGFNPSRVSHSPRSTVPAQAPALR